MKITFHNTLDMEVLPPEFAHKNIPEWYKKHGSYINNKKKPQEATTTATIKKCIPVFDAITSGYLIPLSCDLYVEPQVDESGGKTHIIQYANASGKIDFHPATQALNHPAGTHYGSILAYPKFLNPWAIKTPKGYSCLFVTPTHRNSIFSILPGIVDTDKYYGPVNFPFVMNDPNYNGFIPKGTFIAQVIPFKRDKWNMEIEGEKLKEEVRKKIEILNSTFFNRYKNLFWSPKEYK
jgi:hypothetical protein